MEQQRDFQVNDLLGNSQSRYANQKADLTAFCNLINTLISELEDKGFISATEITPNILCAIADFECTPIVEVVARKYNIEAERIEYERAKQDFLRGFDDAKGEIIAIFERTKQEYSNKALHFYKPQEGGYWRLEYLTITDKGISFDEAKLKEHNCQRVKSKEHAKFLKRAKKLYSDIVDFNKEVSKHSGNVIMGVSGIDATTEAVITINEAGEIIFDANVTSFMDFE